MRHRLLALLLLLGLPLLAVGVAAPASAQTAPSIDVASSATLVARGAALSLDVTVTCEAGYTAYISVAASERSSNAIAQGYGSQTIICTGEPQTITMPVVAGPGAPFRRGVAVVTAYLTVCYYDYCQTVTTTETVQVSK